MLPRLRKEAKGIHTPQTTLSDIREYHNAKKSEQSPLFDSAARIPSDISVTDLQWLHELETHSYIPPWKQEKEIKQADEGVLEPTVNINVPDAIPDSCPNSPLILHEVPDSDEET